MSKTLKIGALALILGVFAATASAHITKDEAKSITGSVANYTFFATSTTDTALATTTSATSTTITGWFDASGRLDTGAMNIKGAQKVTFYFSRAYGGGNSGQTRFEVEVSPDGTNWYDFNKLLGPDVASTATSSYTIVASTTTVPVSMDLSDDTYLFARCIVNETTDGTHACSATAEF